MCGNYDWTNLTSSFRVLFIPLNSEELIRATLWVFSIIPLKLSVIALQVTTQKSTLRVNLWLVSENIPFPIINLADTNKILPLLQNINIYRKLINDKREFYILHAFLFYLKRDMKRYVMSVNQISGISDAINAIYKNFVHRYTYIFSYHDYDQV